MFTTKKAAAFFLAVALPFSGPAVAQQAQSLTTVAAPRLDFSAKEMALAQAAARFPDLASFYGGNDLKPIFAGDRGDLLRQALLQVTSMAPTHGIPVSRYRPEDLAQPADDAQSEIRQAQILSLYLRDMTGGVLRPTSVAPTIKREVRRPRIDGLIAGFAQAPDPARFLADLAPRNPAYLALQDALNIDQDLTVPADLPRAPEAVWRIGMKGPGVLPLRARLDSIGFAAPSGDPGSYDAALSQAVARYQDAVGLPADGIAGPNTIRSLNGDLGGDRRTRAIIISLERMRWLAGEDLNARHVWVNIPEFTAQIMDQGQEVFRTRAVVGNLGPDYETPEFSDQMEYVVVNPRWNVPRSMTVRDYLPRLKANRNAVSHLDVVDGRGRVIPRDQIDFSRYNASNFPYRLRQKSGDDNALGLVKFIFPNSWNIYLHDTPTKHLFGQRNRALSNGCIRISDPFDLAYALLSRQTDNPQAMFQRALDSDKETWLALKPNVPVHLVYFTAFPDASGRIRTFNDVYGRDDLVWAALQKAGWN
ncbi:L,D-transpeptidase family protein [Paracoccus fistulariae]|uniref:L,D-transpeptidase family protein n=1 Tax=Paracoccus fistulariae TaxID=658446 RepID=A0ABY7SLJ0_9RHOB|nr:L,D-transpeptidase family protein [Paracoccus fistulariae]MDB6182554.1 L,D-transpeptidase family protein [Paracoccus fistulariae]WCR07765.1 L,D-transpeptidase family protein [Paracoccus fistulariae]